AEARRGAGAAVDQRMPAQAEELRGERLRLAVCGGFCFLGPWFAARAHRGDGSPLPGGPIRRRDYTRAVAIPASVEQRARWVLDMVGAPGLRLGDDLRYRPEAWKAVERGKLPEGDELAAGFFHLARVEERGAERDRHGRFLASSSCLDPLHHPLERLR